MQKKLETCQSSPVSPCQAGTKCWRGLQEKQHFFFYTLLIHKLKIFMNIRTRTWTLICFLSFKFLTLICSLSFKFFVVCFWVSGHSAFHFQLVQYTFLTARFSATKWGRTYYVLSLKSKISPRWRQVWPSHLFLDLASFVLFCFFVYFFYYLFFFDKLHRWIVPWSTKCVFMEYCEIWAAFMKDYKLYSSLWKLKIQLEMFCSQQTCNLHKIGKEMFWINNVLVYFSLVWELFFFSQHHATELLPLCTNTLASVFTLCWCVQLDF